MVTKAKLLNDLQHIGVKPGDHLALGISLSSIGQVVGGPDAAIDALLESVGSSGTVLIPTYTPVFSLCDVRLDRESYIFDPRTSEAYTGLVPNSLWKRQGAVRSSHPSNSMAALGARAHELLADHTANTGAYSPYSKLADFDGRVLAIGIGDTLVGIRHQAQAMAGLLNVVPFQTGASFRDQDGVTRIFERHDTGGCVTKLPLLVRQMRKLGFAKDGRIGHAHAVLVEARQALEYMAAELTMNPAVNLCDDVYCLWCREVERRLKLQSPIANRLRFGARLALAFYNQARLRQNSLRSRIGLKLVRTLLN